MATVSPTPGGSYEIVVPTGADSNLAGVHRASFLVRAVTATPGIFHDSAVDSGYSVDNLAPAVPTGGVAAYEDGATNLHWSPNNEADFSHYAVYRGETPDFVPGPASLLASTSASTRSTSAARSTSAGRATAA